MQLDNLLSAADPARHAQIDEADSPRAAALYERIVGTSPGHRGGGVPGPERAPARANSRRQAWRTHRRLGVTAAVAAAVVIAVTLGLVVSVDGSRTPRSMLAAGGSEPSASPPSASPPLSSASSQPARLNEAGPVLDALAAVAAGVPPTPLVPGPGQYLYVLDIELKGAPPGGGTSMPCGSVIRQEWLASDGAGRQVGYSPGCANSESHFTQSWGRNGSGLTFDYLAWQGLPTQPAQMEAAIVRRFEGGRANNAMTFLLATGVLNFTAPPAVRSALFRMLATLPGVQYLGQVTDPLGRTGDTIALIQHASDLVVIFDPKTSQVLDEAPTPTGGPIQLPTQMPSWLAPFMYVETGIVGSIDATPPGTKTLLSQIPYQQWVG